MLILDLGIWECVKTAAKFTLFICAMFGLMAAAYLF